MATVAELLAALNGFLALTPFVVNVIQIIREAVRNNEQSIPTQRFLDAWQTALDEVDARGREWLTTHGYDLPPSKPAPEV